MCTFPYAVCSTLCRKHCLAPECRFDDGYNCPVVEGYLPDRVDDTQEVDLSTNPDSIDDIF